MQSEFDKEIDSLLREGARRGRAAPAARVEWSARASEREEGNGGGVRATPSGAHLDADEQNAYAENSLPAPARTHYAAHLADCDDCRRSVTQLALAAGMPSQLEQQAAASVPESLRTVTWRERFGAFFAPHAWRYAVPALALLLVSAVTLIVLLRGRQREVSVAQQQQQRDTPERTKIAAPETHHAPQNGNTAATAPASGEGAARSASNSNAQLTKEEVAAAGASGSQPQPQMGAIMNDAAPPPPPTAPLSTSAGTTANAPAATAAADAANIPTPLPTPAPVPEAMIVTQETEAKAKGNERADELAKDVQRQGNYENNQPRERISGPRRNEQSRNIQRGINAGNARAGGDKNDGAATTQTPSRRAPEQRAAQREADEERNAKSSDDDATNKKGMPLPMPKAVAETRSVAGRKFRRAGGAWIDTAYTSQAVTVVRRNSEQYRALVADEPDLRRISDALGGEVTVVWKGRAYRIR